MQDYKDSEQGDGELLFRSGLVFVATREGVADSFREAPCTGDSLGL